MEQAPVSTTSAGLKPTLSSGAEGNGNTELTEAPLRCPEQQERSRRSQQRYRLRQKVKAESIQNQLKEMSLQVRTLQNDKLELLMQNLMLQRVVMPGQDAALPDPLQSASEGRGPLDAFRIRGRSLYSEDISAALGLAQAVGLQIGPNMAISDVASSVQGFVYRIRSQLEQLDADGSRVASEQLARSIMAQRGFTCTILRSQSPDVIQSVEDLRAHMAHLRPAHNEHLHHNALVLVALDRRQMLVIAEAAARYERTMHRVFAERHSATAALLQAIESVGTLTSRASAQRVQIAQAQARLHHTRRLEYDAFTAMVLLFQGTDTHMLPLGVDWTVIGQIILERICKDGHPPPSTSAAESQPAAAIIQRAPFSNQPLGSLSMATTSELLPQQDLKSREWMAPYLDSTPNLMASTSELLPQQYLRSRE